MGQRSIEIRELKQNASAAVSRAADLPRPEGEIGTALSAALDEDRAGQRY